MPRLLPLLLLALTAAAPAQAEEPPILEVVWPPAGSTVEIGSDPLGVVGVVVRSNFRLMPAGSCGEDARCGHVHMRIDPDGDSCNLPGRSYNSMNSDFGGDLIKANLGACAEPKGPHVIGVLLADDHHQPVLLEGRPVTALVPIVVK
ncbi:hypothetical protein [Neomegalonema perideroedes]|uniref:hypothetical protein n=1 Tax=Neomegalonema perideroedes TaxID=217219 RepID=UPI000378BAD7|nr:hypothetical protein [Neomegalonema perideroedes]